MRGGSSIFEPSTGPKVLKVPRRPVPKGLGENAFFARLRPVGASNNDMVSVLRSKVGTRSELTSQGLAFIGLLCLLRWAWGPYRNQLFMTL